MKVAASIMDIGPGKTRWRCDSCHKVTPFEGSFPEFSVFLVDREGKLIRPIFAREQTPTVPEPLHSCEACIPKIRQAFETKDLMVLPAGALRIGLERWKSRDAMSNMGVVWR